MDIQTRRNQNLEMDPDLAKQLLVDGAILIVLDMPPGTEFGVDLKSWETGDKFKGVKMIPPGIHYIFYSASNHLGDFAPRIGFIHNFQKSEFVVRRWNKDSEQIENTEINSEEHERLHQNILNLDKFLGPYPFDVWTKWKSLSNKVTEKLIKRITPECGVIRSALELVSSNDHQPKRRSRLSTIEDKEEALLPQLKPSPGTELRWTPFPERSYPEDSTPAQITQHSLDSSFLLESMISSLESPVDFIGEFQLAFISFLIGHSLEAFEHWKKLVRLLCSCEDSVGKRYELFSNFLSAIESQIMEIQQDFLADIVANSNFVYVNLRNLFRTIHSSEIIHTRLKAKATRLKDKLTDNFMWDFTDLDEEDEDEKPVVVDLT